MKLVIISLLVLSMAKEYSMLGNNDKSVAADEGNAVYFEVNGQLVNGNYHMELSECEEVCTTTEGCNSFAYCPYDYNRCWLKDKAFTGNEVTRYHGWCSTYYADNQDTGNGVKCADEHGQCPCNGQVRYGFSWDGIFTSWRKVTGSIGCNNSVFGDPIPGKVKACYCRKNRCVGNRATFDAAWGDCSTYVPGKKNHDYCGKDEMDGLLAEQVCHECGKCSQGYSMLGNRDNFVATDLGNALYPEVNGQLVNGHYLIRELSECEEVCTTTEGCNSFLYCVYPHDYNRCWLKDKVFMGNEATRYHGYCSTYYADNQGRRSLAFNENSQNVKGNRKE